MDGVRAVAGAPGCCCSDCPGIVFTTTSSIIGIVKPNQFNWKDFETFTTIPIGAAPTHYMTLDLNDGYVIHHQTSHIVRRKIVGGGDARVLYVSPVQLAEIVVDPFSKWMFVSRLIGGVGGNWELSAISQHGQLVTVKANIGVNISIIRPIDYDWLTGFIYYVNVLEGAGGIQLWRIHESGTGDVLVRFNASVSGIVALTIDVVGRRVYWVELRGGPILMGANMDGSGATDLHTLNASLTDAHVVFRAFDRQLYLSDRTTSAVVYRMNGDGSGKFLVLPPVSSAPAVAPWATQFSPSTLFDFACTS